MMLLGDTGREAGGTSPIKADFCSAVLRGVVTEQQYDFFHE